MRASLLALTFGVLVLPITVMAAQSTSTKEEVKEAVTAQLNQYQAALNASDLDKVMELYAEDSVFMAQNSMPAVGREAVRNAYQQVFAALKLKIHFTIDEIRPLSRDWAFARTRSNGTVTPLVNAQPGSAEGNQEVFLLHREPDGKWRFARYIFSSTNTLK